MVSAVVAKKRTTTTATAKTMSVTPVTTTWGCDSRMRDGRRGVRSNKQVNEQTDTGDRKITVRIERHDKEAVTPAVDACQGCVGQ